MDAIEQRLVVASPLIGRAWVVGEGRPFATALLVLDRDGLVAFAAERGIPDATPEELAEDDALRARVAAAVEAANATLDPAERIRRFTIVSCEALPAVGADAVEEVYAVEIEAMYL
jgi:long-subunit acyl-CoA synthetase (AMP-forming)